MDEFYRQREIITPDDLEGLDIDIAGAGALGGAILFCLCKMGCGVRNRMTITDFDRCAEHNRATQWCRASHVLLGEPKVEALAEMASLLCEREVATVQDRFTGDESRPLGPVVILAVDGIEERLSIWRKIKQRGDVRFLLDARMGAQILDAYAVDLEHDSFDAYEHSLVIEDEPYDEPCTRRAVFYTVLGGAAFVGSLLRAYARGEDFPRHVAFDFRHFFVETSAASPDS